MICTDAHKHETSHRNSHDHLSAHRSSKSHQHHHHNLREQNKTKLLLVLSLISIYMIAAVLIGAYTGSLALIADAAHMLTDVGAILLALFAFWFSTKPAHSGKTFGYYRTEILASIINAIFSLGMSGFILYEAFCRFKNPPSVNPVPVLMMAIIGSIINIFSVKILHESSKHSHNVRGAYLEVLGDFFASIGIIFASIVMIYSKWYTIDLIVSGLIGLLIVPRTWLLLSECTHVLMEGSPVHINLADLRNAILQTAGVVDVHDIHIWTITSGLDAMSGHVKIDIKFETDAVLERLKNLIENDFGIAHSTIQIERQSNHCECRL